VQLRGFQLGSWGSDPSRLGRRRQSPTAGSTRSAGSGNAPNWWPKMMTRTGSNGWPVKRFTYLNRYSNIPPVSPFLSQTNTHFSGDDAIATAPLLRNGASTTLMCKRKETGSDTIAFSPLCGTTLPRVQRQNRGGGYREDGLSELVSVLGIQTQQRFSCL
jgi:hypothetical protein